MAKNSKNPNVNPVLANVAPFSSIPQPPTQFAGDKFFSDLAGLNLTCTPELPFGIFEGKLIRVNAKPSTQPATDGVPNMNLSLVFSVKVGEITFERTITVFDYLNTSKISKDGYTYSPISRVINPIRATAKIPTEQTFTLLDALTYARNNPVYLEHRQDGQYTNFSLVKPPVKNQAPATPTIASDLDSED